MCINPSHVWVKRGPKWEQTPVPCDKCKLCVRNRVDDWVGRCLAEADVSEHVATISLTYAPPDDWRDLSHLVINPHHFQLFMKRLRKAGHKVRYFVAGEYGELQGRSHFHAILFFSDLKPKPEGMAVPFLNRRGHAADPEKSPRFCREIPQDEMVHIREWPHGHVLVDWSCTERSIKYVCEYFLLGKITGWFSMSKKPALGAAWFAEKAQLNRDFDVLPSSFEYLPPGGKPGKKYLMTGATRRDYLNAICLDRAKRSLMSGWVGKTFDKLERQAFLEAADNGKPWGDDRFAALQPPVDVVQARIADEDRFGEGGWRGHAARVAALDVEAGKAYHPVGRVRLRPRRDGKERFWNVPKKHLWYEAACAFDVGCCEGYFTREWVEQYFQSGKGSATARRRFAASCARDSARFDRQGRPIGSGYEPLAGVFERAPRPVRDAGAAAIDAQTGGDLQGEAGE